MSVYVTALVWQADLPKAEQHILLALADHAWDDGSHVYPSVRYTSWKTGATRRTVQRIIRVLEGRHIIEPVAYLTGGRGHATEYRIVLENLPLKAKYGPIEATDADAMRAEEAKGDNVAPFAHDPIKGAKKDTKGAKKDTKGAIPAQKGANVGAPTISNHQETSRNVRAPTTANENDYDPENLADVRRWQNSREGKAYLFSRKVDPASDKITTVRYMLREWLREEAAV